MRIVCVDDEELVLGLTVSMCEKLKYKPEVVGFQEAAEVLKYLKENDADIVFLDINMPDMDGITLAAKIKKIRPDTVLIFLTGYSEFAVDAFKLHASGYLMKPVNVKRLEEEIEWALAGHPEINSSHVMVYTFGDFEVLADGKVVKFARSKSKELLAYLVDRQGADVTRARIFSVLWEDGLYDRSMQKQLDVVIRSLKSTLKEYGISDIIEIQKGMIRIVPEKIDCDLYRFLAGDVNAINTYRGEYMSDYSWAVLTESYMTGIREKDDKTE